MGNTEKMSTLGAMAEIVSSYTLNNKISMEELDSLIQRVYYTVNRLEGSPSSQQLINGAGISVEDSITPDYLICLEDGKKLKMLKRYIKNHYNMTPEEYRKRWNLPNSYPMVAPNYAEKRSQLAKEIGLGKQTAIKRKTKYLKPATKTKNTAILGNDSLPSGNLEIVKVTDIMRASKAV